MCERANEWLSEWVCVLFYWNLFFFIVKCSWWKESLSWKQWRKDKTKKQQQPTRIHEKEFPIVFLLHTVRTNEYSCVQFHLTFIWSSLTEKKKYIYGTTTFVTTSFWLARSLAHPLILNMCTAFFSLCYNWQCDHVLVVHV